MAEGLSIRSARPDDLPGLLRLWRELVGFDEALGGQDFRLAAGTPEKWERHLRSHIGARRRAAFAWSCAGQGKRRGHVRVAGDAKNVLGASSGGNSGSRPPC